MKKLKKNKLMMSTMTRKGKTRLLLSKRLSLYKNQVKKNRKGMQQLRNNKKKKRKREKGNKKFRFKLRE